MKYVKRYNKFSLQTNCRICLTQSVTTKLSLTAPLKGERSPRPLVYEALELVTNEKVPLSSKYPNTICGMCAELLKISYDLISQFQVSKMKLKEQLKELGEDSESDTEDKEETKLPNAPVEIVVGSEKFNIKDLLIVEEDSDDTAPFDGFLRNLGKSISASFVKKGYKKPKPNMETPSLIIEKVIQEPIPESSKEPRIIEMCMQSITSSSNNENTNNLSEDNEDQFIDEPVNTEAFDKLMILNDKDKDVLESALNLKYKCPYCSKPMASLMRAKIHSRSCGKNSLNVTCYVCGASFEVRKHLLRHIKQTHLTDLKRGYKFHGVARDKYACRVCGKVFASNGSLFYHMSKHSGKRYGCEKCEKRFYTKTQAQSHTQTHSKEKTVVVCPICGKGFHYQSGLFYHMKMHTNDRNLQCSYCPRRFYTRNSLKRHELTHTGGRPYSCQFCEKKFRSLGEVRKHELLHTGERPFQCKYCDMGFTQAHNLKMHSMTHSGEFQCVHCCKGFADAEILRFHLKNKHQVVASEAIGGEAYEDMKKEIKGQEDEVLAATEGLELDGTQAFYITEQYEDDGDDNDEPNSLIFKTYELRDEVLVETVENLNQEFVN